MPAPLSMEKREQILAKHKEGLNDSQVARVVETSPKTVGDILRLYNSTGSLVPRLHDRGPKSLVAPDVLAKLKKCVEEEPEVTLVKLIERFELVVGESALSKIMKKNGYKNVRENRVWKFVKIEK